MERLGCLFEKETPAMNRGRKVVPPPLGNGFNSKLIMLKDRQELPARPESDGLYWILSGAIQTSIISEDVSAVSTNGTDLRL
ncbi:hypothetical protein [Sphingomonas koreensis]|uniref:hypothetical protein n=1 Tax=Sphingomonas koreensis TaxID=93064 RepID=UPI001F49CC94|nr:hypothetical protein [Sphingomonas koreensis]